MAIVRGDIRALAVDRQDAAFAAGAVALEGARFQFHRAAGECAEPVSRVGKSALGELRLALLNAEGDAVAGGESGADGSERGLGRELQADRGGGLDAAGIEIQFRAFDDGDGGEFADAVADELHTLNGDARRAHGKAFASVALDDDAAVARDRDRTGEDEAAGIKSGRNFDRGTGRGAGESAGQISR